jgi:hypothetical protein
MHVPRATRLVALALAGSMMSCSTTATIYRVNGPAYEAEIVGSDPDALEVRAENGRV